MLGINIFSGISSTGAPLEESEHGQSSHHSPVLPKSPQTDSEISPQVLKMVKTIPFHNARGSYKLNCFSGRGDDTVPNLTDSLFVKIFEKNKFSRIEVMIVKSPKFKFYSHPQAIEVWCKTLSIKTAEWFVRDGVVK